MCEGAVGATWRVQGGLGLLWSLPAASPTIFIKGLPGGHERGWGLKEAIAHSRKLGAAGGPTLLVKCLSLPVARGEVGGGWTGSWRLE